MSVPKKSAAVAGVDMKPGTPPPDLIVNPAATLPAVKKEQPVAVVDWEPDEGAGYEETTGDDFAIPFLQLLQKGSPQADPDDGAYVQGARVGQLLDTATQELFDTVDVVPCFYRRSMVEWKDREQGGGGFVAQHEVGAEAGLSRDESGRYVTDRGTYLADTRYFFCLRLAADGAATPVIVSMSSTQIKKARTWLTRMQSLKATGASGHRFTLPMFANIWRIGSVPEQNDKGSWRGYKIDLVGPVTDATLAQEAKDARAMFQSVAVKVKPPAEGSQEAAKKVGDDIPY